MRIRPGNLTDISQIQRIEYEAAVMFEPYGLCEIYREAANPLETIERAITKKTLWVCEVNEHVVAFAMAQTLKASTIAHLDELDVLPAYHRQGIGRQLVSTVCSWAEQRKHSMVTLSTLREPPFNAPFYSKLGFVILQDSDFPPPIAQMRKREIEAGWQHHGRVMMAKYLTSM